MKDTEDLWLEVADYLEEAYDLEKVEKIYISGEGARWIKEGLNWIKGSEYVLDYLHLSKYVRKATAHIPQTFEPLWRYINIHQKDYVKQLLNFIIEETESETKKGADQMARLRVYNANDGNIYQLMSERKKARLKERQIIKIESKTVKNKIKAKIPDKIDNIPYINDGRRTWQRQILRSIRGA